MYPLSPLTDAAAANAMVLQAAKNQLPDKAKKDKQADQVRFAELMEDHTTVLPMVNLSKSRTVGQFSRSLSGALLKRKINKMPNPFNEQQYLFEMEPTPLQLLLDQLEHDSTIPKYIDINA